MLSCDSCIVYPAAALLLLVLSYLFSATLRYFIRITLFYLLILLHGMECCITMIPFFFLNRGGDYIFRSFYYWCRWTGIQIEVRDYDKHLANLAGPAIVICNHQSAVDVFTMCATWPPKCTVMMKKSLQYIPFFNVTSWLARAIFIDRFNKEKALEQVEYCARMVKERDLKLWVFPEGTRCRERGMLPFKKGAFNIAVKAGIPIVPIVVSNYSPFYSKQDRYFHSDGEVIAQVLPPVPTTGLSLDDVEDLAATIREHMLQVYEQISDEAAERMAAKRAKKLN